MDVYIDKRVHLQIEDFYDVALLRHPSLDEVIVMRKIQRLYDALELLGLYASIYPISRIKEEWITKGYREYIIEDFHFAYQIYKKENGEVFVRVHDACHSFLYHE